MMERDKLVRWSVPIKGGARYTMLRPAYTEPDDPRVVPTKAKVEADPDHMTHEDPDA